MTYRQKSNYLTSREDNTRMIEGNDENETEFICKNLGNMRIGRCRRVERWRNYHVTYQQFCG